MTSIDWRANRLVDALAKRAVAFHKIDKRADAVLTSAAALSQHSLAQLARVTHFANNLSTTVYDDQGKPTTKVTRDSTDKPRFARTAARKRPLAKQPTPPRDISMIEPWAPAPVLEHAARKKRVRTLASQ